MGLRTNRFIEKSLLGAVSFFKDSVFAEEFAVKNYFLQSLDPRVKTFSFIVLIIAVLFAKDIVPILTIYGFVLVLTRLSGISLPYFLKRTWIFIPLFSLFIAIPAVFETFSPGEAVFTFDVFGVALVITKQGLSSAGLFISRVITSVSIVVLLSLTTKHAHILYTLRIFKVPTVFVMTMGMCYRYIYLFVKMIGDTYFALKSRAGQAIPSSHGRRIVAWNIANLWHRSYYMHKEVHQAMVSRGYSGDSYILDDFKTGAKDWIWLTLSVIVLSAILFTRH